MDFLPEALKPLAAYNQFIVWEAVQLPGKTKLTKWPINPHTGQKCNAHDSDMWLNYEEAIKYAKQLGLGVGFVFTKEDPFWFHDIDNCLVNGQWSELSTSICNAFQGCAVELSQSKTGLHIIGSGPTPEHSCRNDALGLEFYTEGRFVALTGYNIIGSSATEKPEAINWLISNYFPKKEPLNDAHWTDYPSEDWNGPGDDTELLQKILNSKSASNIFGGRASVQQLWAAEDDALASSYPDQVGDNAFNHSSADAALCQHLAFWTGKDCERMDRLFRMSGLCRSKWEDREDYRRSTILLAVGNCTSVYSGKKKKELPEPAEPKAEVTTTEITFRSGDQMLFPTQQLDFFKGCVYINDLHRVLTPNGMFLKSEQFKSMYGGYTFILDGDGEKSTRNAWECFTESQTIDYPKVNTSCFRPELKSLGTVKEDGLLMVNTYVPIITPRKKGDPSPWLDHLTKMVPDNRDRQILISYAAACVQYPGKKFQWAPLLQGVEGNGKSLFFEVISRAVGYRYTHKPKADDISNVFNAWISNKLFIIVEEVYTSDRREVIDALKPLITDSRVPITPKGVDQVTGDNRANFGLTTNHKDAIRKTKNDRRFSIFFTAQQDDKDLDRFGMRGAYFPNFINWLEREGYAIVNDFLRTYQIPEEFNPAKLCVNAPKTSSTAEALSVSLGAIEQEVLECVESGRLGFKGGWISSMAFDRLLAENKVNNRIPRNKRRGILESLGYFHHPTLKNGRLTRSTAIDGGKTRLYIKTGHIHCNLATVEEVERVYTDDQGANIDATGPAIEVFS